MVVEVCRAIVNNLVALIRKMRMLEEHNRDKMCEDEFKNKTY